MAPKLETIEQGTSFNNCTVYGILAGNLHVLHSFVKSDLVITLHTSWAITFK